MNGQRIALRQQRDLSEIVQAAANLYQQNFAPLLVIAAVVMPLGIAAAIFQDALIEGDSPFGLLFFPVALLQAAVNLLASAGLIFALIRIDQAQPLTFSEAYDAVFERGWALLGAASLATFIALLPALTVIGLVGAAYLAVIWLFVGQAVIIDGAGPTAALRVSAQVVQGRWWRTLGLAIVIGLITIAPAAIVGAGLVFTPAIVSGTVSSFVTAAMLPFAVTAMTLLYLDLQVRKELDDSTTSDTAT